MPLPDADRIIVANQLMRDDSAGKVDALPGNLRKPDLRAAVIATDNWIDDNAASFAAALPPAFRTATNLQQKTALFVYVAMRRANLLRAEED